MEDGRSGDPGIFVYKGRFVTERDAAGEGVSFEHKGTVIDVCPLLD